MPRDVRGVDVQLQFGLQYDAWDTENNTTHGIQRTCISRSTSPRSSVPFCLNGPRGLSALSVYTVVLYEREKGNPYRVLSSSDTTSISSSVSVGGESGSGG